MLFVCHLQILHIKHCYNIARVLALYKSRLSRYEQNLYLRTPVRK